MNNDKKTKICYSENRNRSYEVVKKKPITYYKEFTEAFATKGVLEEIMKPILYLIVPCYNEEEVLPITSKMFLDELKHLINCNKIHEDSRIMYVDDGSSDKTWELITNMTKADLHFLGLRLSRNKGHQNAVMAGLMEARNLCDITISIDCDGQDDIKAAEQMVDEYMKGSEIVYGVRSDRKQDSFFKRITAQSYYRFLAWLGVELVSDHADYRLASSKVLAEFAGFEEVNLFLRGLFPLVGFKSSNVFYSRTKRLAGKTHYPMRKMLTLAEDGVTSLSVRPIRIITALGTILTMLSLIGMIIKGICLLTGAAAWGIGGICLLICFFGGLELLATGVIGEYIGKTYLETKKRPRYIIQEKTWDA